MNPHYQNTLYNHFTSANFIPALSMASSSKLHFHLVDGMQLQINVLRERNVRVELQLKNCIRPWILHWGFLFPSNPNWYIPADHGYKLGALQTPFSKSGELYVVIIELRDPKIRAIEFVLKDGGRDRWLKLNNGNFRIEVPEHDENAMNVSIPRELVERKAYLTWESKGRPASSPQQQKQDYGNALKELQSQLARGISLNELQSHSVYSSPVTKTESDVRDVSRLETPPSFRRRHDVDSWLQKHPVGVTKDIYVHSSPFMDLVEKNVGGDDVISRLNYHVGNCEIVVLLKVYKGDRHILVAINSGGTTVLHWGVSKSFVGEWLAPPPDILPETSNRVTGACQTYFRSISTGKGFFQHPFSIVTSKLFPLPPAHKKLVDINMQQKSFVGIQFVIWSGGSWIKNNGSNFFVDLKAIDYPNRKGNGDEIAMKWLLDDISRRETEAERSLMHRFNIATELTEHCKGEMDLIGIFVWMRFMACRHLTWNKNYNVKPREISEAQDKFTNLLHRLFLSKPKDRETVRLIMSCVGRGGQGDVGQRIRDEILVLQRNNDCKTGMMEEWHQKLHNNSSPDDVIICEALLDYVRSGFRIDAYWKTLHKNGLTKDKLASYDRPIVSEPRLRTDIKDGLIRDLTMYLKTLKAVHSGADLESAIETCLGPLSKDCNLSIVDRANSVGGLSLKLQESLNFVRKHIGDDNIGPLMEKLLESRIELRPLLLTSHGKGKDLLFLDLALASVVRTTMERGLKDITFAHPPDVMLYLSLLLENLCLSTVANEDLIYCIKDWYRVCELYKPNDAQWALQAKAVLDRLQLVLADRSQKYQKNIQPSAQYLGNLLGVKKWAIDSFTEEMIRLGPAAVLSSFISRCDPVLRKVANLGCWQVISAVEVSGFVTSVTDLITIQNKVYKKPTVLIATRVTGEEEIPDGVVGVLTSDMPDILSHVSIRARNNKVCFATCFDQNLLRNLKMKEAKAISIHIKSMNLVISDISGSTLLRNCSSSVHRAVHIGKKTFCGKYAISVEEFTPEMVGAKSSNIKYLREKVPSWINIPTSVAIPFGAFEAVLSEDNNKDIAKRILNHCTSVSVGDLTKLKEIQFAVQQMSAPPSLANELKRRMRSARILLEESDDGWNHAWQSIKKVWASKWNERAYISCQKAKLNHDNIRMAVLIQEVICADYAFVIHTKNPLSGDTSEIYTEIVKGLGETLVGAYQGRAMSFITKKDNLRNPIVIGYPSKNIGLYSKRSIIFRSDSNGEDLAGYAGAGLYDSVLMDEPESVVLDYSRDRMICDRAFQISLFSRIAEAGKLIETLYGGPQDIEGVVKDGMIYVVQSRPQI